LVGSASLVAVNVAVCVELMLVGAVKNPRTRLPILGVTDQFTPVFVVPPTIAVYCSDWPATSIVRLGTIETLTFGRDGVINEIGCPSNTTAVPLLLGSSTLVAEIVTCRSLPNEDGAV
jgi:hypothetical protein